ncbi:hypothetical protein LSTR_LSTR008252 [Laodelphax striatellus]|uniref:Uncharacterized protein n=1 Tax=Laodelphax striatellus TaxID=195883 RepID=A0A482XNW9_LAOST|nr:hypothetical protein LSTR_LSTR008252 [Laodelphax striatellus]
MKKHRLSAQPMREATKRLNSILRTARKLGVTDTETARLAGARKLCGVQERWSPSFLALAACLVIALLVLLTTALPSDFLCAKNTTSEIQTVRYGLHHEEADSWIPTIQLRRDR